MRVLYFHQHFSTPQGATGTRSYEMALSLLRAGHQVTMVCGSYKNGNTGLNSSFKKNRRRGVVEGIDVIEFDLDYGNHMGFWQRVSVFAKFALGSIGVALREPFDVVFATSTPLTAGIPGIVAKWFRGKPFVFEVRDLWPELPRAMGEITNPVILSLMSVLEWVSYKSADRLIGLSPGIVDGIAQHLGDKSSITMVPNGCDLDLFNIDTPSWRPPGVSEGELLAIYTGTHGTANGLDALLDAAAVLKRRRLGDIKIILVGQGLTKEHLMRRAEKESLDNVIFIDPMSKGELVNLLNGADVGLQILKNVPAFYYGTSPNKFFDYIAAGLPVVTNYPGWLCDLLEENECGFVAAPDDPEALADVLSKCLFERHLLQPIGKRARMLAEKNFNRRSLGEHWVSWVTNIE